MQAASQAGNLLAVYTVRHKLLQSYPELVEDPKLVAEMVVAAERQQSAVKFVDEVRTAETSEATSLTLASVALTSTTGNPPTVDDADTVMIVDSGSAYALDPRTGKPRWLGSSVTRPTSCRKS